MKKDILILRLIILLGWITCSNPVEGQQFYVEQTYTIKQLKSVWFIDANKGFVVGENGALKSTTDGGTTWNWIKVTSKNLQKIYFIDNNIGIIAGDQVFLRTTDGGTTWTVTGVAEYIVDMSFVSATVGYATGPNNIFKTIDAGITWSKITGPGFSSALTIFFVDANIGYVGDQLNTWKTSDGGLTWSKITVTSATFNSRNYNSLWFLSATTGYLATSDGVIQKTTDGGATWTSQITTNYIFGSIRFTDANNGYAVGTGIGNTEQGHPIVLTTTNGGSTWVKKDIWANELVGFGNGTPLFVAGNKIGSTLFCVGYGDYIYKSTDSGLTWTNLSGFGYVNTVYFIDTNIGIAAGAGVYKTIDGGKTWRIIMNFIKFQTPPDPSTLAWGANSILFTSSTVGYIAGGVGGYGGIIKTIDQGETWQKIDESSAYWDMDFLDANNGFFTEDEPGADLVKKTVNGGTTITKGPNVGTIPFSLDFVSTSVGFYTHGNFSAVQDESIWKTTNGGTSWTKVLNVLANKGYDFSSLKFIDATTGFVVGGNGAIFKTSDGGNTWTQYASTVTTQRLRDIAFYNSTIGFIVAEDGSILRTNDTGVTWSLETINAAPIQYSFTPKIFSFVNGKGFVAASTSVFTISTTPNKQDQTITFPNIANKTLGDAPFAPGATASSALTVTYTSSTDKVTINGSQVTLVKAGRAIITANQAGNATFNPAPPVDKNFCIFPAIPTITMTNGNTATPTLTTNAVGTIQWLKDGGFVTGGTNSTLSVTSPGVYSVQVKVDDCQNSSANFPVIVTGDISLKSEPVLVYPNPSKDFVFVTGIKNAVAESMVVDVTGRSSAITLERQGDVLRGEIGSLGGGIYILRIREGGAIHQLKFIKM